MLALIGEEVNKNMKEQLTDNSALPLLISFSGGKTSGFMTAFLQEHFSERQKAIVFANTGKEREQTLEFVNECDKRWNLGVVWVEAVIHPQLGKGTTHKIVNYETASRNGEPFEAMIQKFGIPNKSFPHCTRELKMRPIHSFIKKDLGWKHYETAIGIRADEMHRINPKEAEKMRYIYPLAHLAPVDQRMINAYWENQSFTLHLKEGEGNCDYCWKKSEKKLIRLINDERRKTRELPIYMPRFQWWKDMVKKYSALEVEGRKKLLEPASFYRGNMTPHELEEKAIQVEEDTARQGTLFDMLDETESDCLCKSSGE